MKWILAGVAVLVAASAASAPVIDEDALKASLTKGTVKVVSLATASRAARGARGRLRPRVPGLEPD